MKKLFVFIGDSGSGKTAIIAELTKMYPGKFKKIVTCTSRKMRTGEVEGVDYHFKSRDYFVDNQDLVLVKKTDDGDNYGTIKSDLFSDNMHLLLTSKASGISKLSALGLHNIVIVRIAISEILKVERMRQRGDSNDAIKARLMADDSNTTNFISSNLQIIDLDANQPLDEKVQYVLRAC